MARILITGSSGFLGAAASAQFISGGHEVIGLDPAPPPQGARHRHVADDLSDRARLDRLLAGLRPSHVLHAGGVSGPMVLADRPAEVMAVNVAGTLRLLEAALAAGVARFVFCSSIAAVGAYGGATPIGPDQPLRPETPYGCSKAAVEFVLQGLWRRVPMELCALRFTGIYGPGRRTQFVLDDMVAAALAGRTVRIPPTEPAPYLYGDDAAAAAVAACLAAELTQRVYYVAHPALVAMDEIRAIIARHAGPLDVFEDAALPPARRGPVDLGPTARDLGFTARVDIAEGLARLIAARRG
jgi:nucleoside-diphosphate-sugar epimerase